MKPSASYVITTDATAQSESYGHHFKNTCSVGLATLIVVNMISHIAIAVDHEVSRGSYMARSSKPAKRQQVHAVIKIIINARLTGRLHSSKSLTTPFIKILHRQTFAPYGI